MKISKAVNFEQRMYTDIITTILNTLEWMRLPKGSDSRSM